VRGSQKVVFFVAKINKADLEVLRELLEAGTVTPLIDRRYELSETADALRYLGEGHAQTKVVITVPGSDSSREVLADEDEPEE
jgi:NADPH:quinone reductase-like Zn-dependent oxidoreductase